MERINDGTTIKIRISGLSNGLHEYHFSTVPSKLGLEKNFTKPVEVDVVVDKTLRQVYLKSNIKTSGLFSCDRCIEEFERLVDTQYSTVYLYDEQDNGRYVKDEVQIIGPDTVFIDLSDDVRQMMLLSVPLKLLCKEDCKGLCPHCGVNRNAGACDCKDDVTDARWQGLEGLSIT